MRAHRVVTRAFARLFLPATFLVSLAALPAQAVQIVGMPIEFTSSVTYNAGTGLFEYRYSFTDLSNAAQADALRVTVNEGAGHLGVHHEGNFLIDGGAFGYDRPAPVLGIGIHNYDWTDLDLAALGTTTIGFDDVHGPTMANMRVEYAPTLSAALLTAPVPFVGAPFEPGPGAGGGGIEGGLGGICLVTVLGDNKCYTYLGTSVTAVAGGFQYTKFLKNTGAVPIGPDQVAGVDNYVDHFEAVHPTHVNVNDEVFNLPDNGCAGDGFGKLNDTYFWLGLGDGLGGQCANGAWDVGEVLALGFFDTHGPALTPWNGIVFGSQAEGGSTGLSTSPDNPAVPAPASGLLLVVALLGLGWLRRRS